MLARSVRLGSPKSARHSNRWILEELEDRSMPAAIAEVEQVPVVPIIDGPMLVHLRSIAEFGQQQGNRMHVFAKVGDSITATTNYLVPLGDPSYNPWLTGLAQVGPELLDSFYLYRTPIDGSGYNSFNRPSAAAFAGWTTVDGARALPNELTAIKPAIALIMFGTNDMVLFRNSAQFAAQLRDVAQVAIDHGVIPILSTIPDFFYQSAEPNPAVHEHNQMIVQVARELNIPVWNYWKAIQELPRKGISVDAVHPSTAPAGAAWFGPGGLLFGYNVRNLTALQVLDHVRELVFSEALPEDYTPPQTTPWKPLQVGQEVTVVSPDAGKAPVVRVLDAEHREWMRFLAYEPTFLGGVRTTVADWNRDGVPDLWTVPAKGGSVHLKIFSGKDGSVLRSHIAFQPQFRGGGSVAAGDVDGDGWVDAIVGAGFGGGPAVQVLSGATGQTIRSFFAYAPNFRGGVNVAAADTDGDGIAEIITGAASAGGPQVNLIDGRTGTILRSFFAYAPTVDGVNVVAGDLDGDGVAEIVTGPGSGSGHIRVFAGRTFAELRGAIVSDPDWLHGVRVAVVPARAGQAYASAKILTSYGRLGSAVVRQFDAGSFALQEQFLGDVESFWGGIWIGSNSRRA